MAQTHKQVADVEWQNLAKLFLSKNGKQLLSDLSEVIYLLKDTKTQPWQKRTNSILQLKTIFVETEALIQRDPDIVNLV